MEKFTWVNFYKELAKRLLYYRNNRMELVQKVYRIYEKTGLNMPKMDANGKLVDIDPFSFYAMFNKNLTISNRLLMVKAIAEELNVVAELPRDFGGVPTAQPLNATYYQFLGERNDDDIDKLWELFEAALDYVNDKSWEKRETLKPLFNYAINMKYNGVGKITMALFWIAPDVFLNFDSRSKWFIYESGKLPEGVVKSLPSLAEVNERFDAELYFDILEKIDVYIKQQGWRNFVGFSQEAWSYSEEINKKKKHGNTEAEDTDRVRYWVYSPGPNADKWEQFYQEGVMGIGWGRIGDISKYGSMEEISAAIRDGYGRDGKMTNIRFGLWEFAHTMKPGDVVFAKKGRTEIVGRGVVEGDYYYDESESSDYNNKRRVNWTHKGTWAQDLILPTKTLTDISDYDDYVKGLAGLFSEMDDDLEEAETKIEVEEYGIDRFLSEVYTIDEEKLGTILDWLEKEKNIILQGAPGVGKTFVARRLAYVAMGVKDPSRVCLVQFHQSYSYEDFIEGFRPASGNEKGFEIRKGIFYSFCEKAKQDPENSYYFIIDEINRGNLSKIFGELFMLIEKDKRNVPVQLLYSDEKFRVPENVYIIGTMNTADRSLALLDYALRRRFVFFDLAPAFHSDGFEKYRKRLGSREFDRLIGAVDEVNRMIEEDSSLGDGFRIGHSYLAGLGSVDSKLLMGIVEYKLLPLLGEYWFDNQQNYDEASRKLKGALL